MRGGVRGRGRAPSRAAAVRGRSRGTTDRRVEHDARHPRGVERTRPRSPRVLPVRVRRQRTGLRGGDRPTAREAEEIRGAAPAALPAVYASPLRAPVAPPTVPDEPCGGG